MNIYPYEKKYAVQIAALLNNFLPFEPETAKTVDQVAAFVMYPLMSMMKLSDILRVMKYRISTRNSLISMKSCNR